jgi:biopolymer transport protein ExbD
MRRRRAAEPEEADVNLTPMLDVVFIMLIFFIVTASFVKESGVEIQRPSASTAEKKTAAILIAITAEDEIWLQKRPIDVRSVRANVERLLAENPQSGVVIQADRNSKNGVLVQVIDQARLAGAVGVSLAADEQP